MKFRPLHDRVVIERIRRGSLLSCLGYFTEATCKWITFTSV
jgi:hypothetical protein